MPDHLLRSLPSIERLLERPLALQLSAALGRERVRDLLREVTDEFLVHENQERPDYLEGIVAPPLAPGEPPA